MSFQIKLLWAADEYLSLSGWTKSWNLLTLDFLREINDYGVSTLFILLSRDGRKQGPNFELTKIADI